MPTLRKDERRKREQIKNLIKYTIEGRWDKMEPIIQLFPKIVNEKIPNYYHSNGCFYRGYGLLHYACFSKSPDTDLILRKLICDYKANINIRTPSGQITPLHFASAYGKYNQVKTLVFLGANTKMKSKWHAYPIDDCCTWYGTRNSQNSNMANKIKLLLRNPPKVPYKELAPCLRKDYEISSTIYRFDKIERCEDEPDEPVADE